MTCCRECPCRGKRSRDHTRANVKGTIYAVCNRCGHQNAQLPKGTLFEHLITCPLLTRRST